jgi:hypothetical protein
MEDAGRDQVEDVLALSDDDGVTRIRAALVARDDVDMFAEAVDNFTLPLIAPLGADNDLDRHRWFPLEIKNSDDPTFPEHRSHT